MSSSLDEILTKYVAADGVYKDKLQALGFIVVDKNGKTLYSNSLGKQTLTSENGSFTNDTVCWIASMTKLITAVACLQLVEQDLISLDDDVGNYIPELADLPVLTGFDDNDNPILEKKESPITLRNLLTHSSGFTYDKWDPILIKFQKSRGHSYGEYKTMDDFVYPLKFQPGSNWEYGIGLDWAGRLIEILKNTTLEEYFKEHIFGPLGMESSTLVLQSRPDLVVKRAEIPVREKETGELVSGPDTVETNRKVMGGGGGLFSTAHDYSLLLKSLISNDGKLLSPSYVSTLLGPSISEAGAAAFQARNDKLYSSTYPYDAPGIKFSHALGGALVLNDVEGKRRGGSCRWSGVSNPQWWIDTESGVAAVLMAQASPVYDAVLQKAYDEIERAVYRDLVGK